MPAWKIQSLRSDYVARLHRETLKMVSEDDSLGWVTDFVRVHASIVASGAALVLCMPLGGATILAIALVWNIVVSAEYAWWRGGAPSAAWRARIREHYRFVAPLSALMILPDAYLVNVLGTLRFPPAPLRFLGVPVHMGLMWSMNLLPMLVVLDACKPHAGDVLPLAAAALSLLLFGAAEAFAVPLGLWEPTARVRARLPLGGLATYVLPAEAALGALVEVAFCATRRRGAGSRLLAAAGCAAAYTLALHASFRFVDG